MNTLDAAQGLLASASFIYFCILGLLLLLNTYAFQGWSYLLLLDFCLDALRLQDILLCFSRYQRAPLY